MTIFYAGLAATVVIGFIAILRIWRQYETGQQDARMKQWARRQSGRWEHTERRDS